MPRRGAIRRLPVTGPTRGPGEGIDGERLHPPVAQAADDRKRVGVQVPGGLEVALAGRHVDEVDPAECRPAYVPQLPGQGDGFLVQCAPPGVVAELHGGVGQVVRRVGDALSIAELPVERRLPRGTWRRPGSRPA